ncbi:MAG TPA: DUF2235 domain-containing protein [Allosphingosinicella sp.]|nr:DUF2235 domain-containing protein [Allosphingosinicella sp.]
MSDSSKKKIAIFCDGTWNDLSMANSTNVVRLARSVADHARDSVRSQQIVYYDEGVGVAGNVSWLIDRATRIVGGALGRGLDRKVENAYRFLVLNYCPGDEIYVFGFSRGAYTARSLCGMIRKCGILRRAHFDHVDAAMRLYRSKETKDSPDAFLFRSKFAHSAATAFQDVPEADRQAAEIDSPDDLAALYQYRPAAMVRLMYAGIWDTVGAMGIPEGLDLLGQNKKYEFHDLEASNLTASIRHAVAANDKRNLFDATLYGNLDRLNEDWANRTGYNVRETSAANFVPYPYRPYQQRWFPGDHGSVGGGSRDRSHSSAALQWIAEGAEWAGLAFDWKNSALGHSFEESDWRAELGPNSTLRLPGGRRRAAGPQKVEEVAEETYLRYHEPSLSYRPRNLRKAMDRSPSTPAPHGAPKGFPPIPRLRGGP